jgi:endonuclease YncB( thermonuclease family)
MILTLSAAAALAICPPSGARVNCVVDGDTLWLDGEKIRIAEIDTPEINGRCAAERALALRARGRLIELLGDGPVRFKRVGTDKFGRTLATFGSVSEQMISEGLAHRWPNSRGWCG